MGEETRKTWLLLIHQIPPKPDYLRVKIWRRMHQVGAVAVKQSVYVLPQSDQALEDFNWILKEIAEGGGDGSISEAVFLEGLSDAQVVGLFQAARGADYEKIIEELRALADGLSGESPGGNDGSSKLRTHLSRLRRRFEEVAAIDFFGASGGGAAEGALADVAARLAGAERGPKQRLPALPDLKGRTWATRRGVYVDRIACAWLIRRFVDPAARFKFVSSKKYEPQPNELRFDMFDAEFMHDGDLCSFEVMIRGFGLDPKLLAPIAEIVHDIDLKDEKFCRPETVGIKTLFSAIVTAHPADEDRIEIGGRILDDLFEHYKKQVKA